MAESQARNIFGIHDVSFLNRADYSITARYRVTGNVAIDMPAEFAELRGGSQLFSWKSAVSSFKPTCSIVGRQISSDIMEMNLSADVTEYGADATGDVILEANKKNASIIDATTGIASITLKSGDEGDAKEGWYLIKCPGAGATVNVYAMSSSDFDRGTKGVMGDDHGLITPSPVTITT